MLTGKHILSDMKTDFEILRDSFRASRLRGRWLNVQALMFDVRMSQERRDQVRRICNRLAERIDALNPWENISSTPRI